ncbi:hypothetical protein BT69DRAFT_1336416 [Atractiella rhizophila]|nr:hypothetical protein BT69DRAFT_1336416 [Atractiella rhizophila]
MSSSIGPTVEEQLHLALQSAAVEEVVSTSRTYFTAACFAIYSWDFILTFPNEYRTMWGAERWTPVHIAFFFNRYWGLLDVVIFLCLFWLKIDPKTCEKPPTSSFKQTDPRNAIVAVSCEFLLGARVWVMWNRRKWIAGFFSAFAICGFAVQIWAVVPSKSLPVPPGLRGCIAELRDQKNYVYWIPPLLYDTTATIFVLVALISHWRKSPRTHLLTIFARDGVVYFLVVFTCNLINAIYFGFVILQPTPV